MAARNPASHWTDKYPSAIAALINLNMKTARIDSELRRGGRGRPGVPAAGRRGIGRLTVKRKALNRLTALRGPDESYSDVHPTAGEDGPVSGSHWA